MTPDYEEILGFYLIRLSERREAGELSEEEFSRLSVKLGEWSAEWRRRNG